MTTTPVAEFRYDDQGYLREAWDPRVTPALKSTYEYTNGFLTKLTPPGEEPWTFTYHSTTAGEPNAGRLKSISRSALAAGTATTSLVYGVPLVGANAPYQMGSGDVAAWAQNDVPTDATAVFPATAVPASTDPTALSASDYRSGTIHYLNRQARETNTAEPGGHILATEYDRYGNVIRELSAANRRRALESPFPAETARILDTQYLYSGDGLDLWEMLGPRHQVQLASGELVQARAHATLAYDEGAPAGGPYHLPTPVTVAAQIEGREDADARVSKVRYDGQSGLGWTLRQPTSLVTDASTGGLSITDSMLYDATTGLEVERRMPSDPSGQSAGTTKTIYYTADANPVHPDCGNKPQWANLKCKTLPAAQPGTPGLPDLPVTTMTWTRLNQPATVTESAGGTPRTTTYRYDGGGRKVSEYVTSAVGGPIPEVTYTYDPSSGYLTGSSSTEGGATSTITRSYDALGRLIRYEDASGNVATTSYDVLDRPVTRDDGKGTQTLTYDPVRGVLIRLEDSHAGTFTADTSDYDPDGNLTRVVYPNGLAQAITYDEIGSAGSLSYTQTQNCSDACDWLAETVVSSIHGQWLRDEGTLSQQSYAYDAAGRLSEVRDIVEASCTIRSYVYDVNANRTALTTREPAEDGSCDVAATGNTETHSYDTADRLIDSGYTYDAFGRTLSIPSKDVNGGDLALTYFVNDLVKSITQDGVTQTFWLDPEGRVRTRTDAGGDSESWSFHYADDSDSPAWAVKDADGSRFTRDVQGMTGDLVAIHDSATGTELQLTNMHGDVIATATTSSVAPGPMGTFEADEFGVPRSPAPRFGWLGGKQRQTIPPSGVVLMGVRVYSPTLGRFLQVDPIEGGSLNDYEYATQDPINSTDLLGLFATRWTTFSRTVGPTHKVNTPGFFRVLRKLLPLSHGTQFRLITSWQYRYIYTYQHRRRTYRKYIQYRRVLVLQVRVRHCVLWKFCSYTRWRREDRAITKYSRIRIN